MEIKVTREELLSLISYAASNKMIRMIQEREASSNDTEAEKAISDLFDRYERLLSLPDPKLD